MRRNSITMPDGSRLELRERGGRVLGLYPPDGGENFFWTPATPPQNGGWNFGGDRTWISPEVDVFVPDFPDTSVFRVPPQLDPGEYRLTGVPPQLAMRCTLPVSRFRTTARVEIVKSWTPAPDPIGATHVQYAGYTQTTEFHADGATLALWSILQVPFGGIALISVHGCAAPKRYAGAISGKDLQSSPGLVRYFVRRQGLAKFGIDPISATGRAGYLWTSDGHMNFVVRQTSVNPCAIYGDIAWVDPENFEERGSAIQICSVDNELGSYAELEHHAPAGGPDISQTCCWRGRVPDILEIARRLMGEPLP